MEVAITYLRVDTPIAPHFLQSLVKILTKKLRSPGYNCHSEDSIIDKVG